MIVTILETGESTTFKFLRVDFSNEAHVTDHPVEFGAEVSDHVQILPIRFTAEVAVTASPLSAIPQPFAIDDAVGFLERALGKISTVVIPGEGTFSSMVLESVPHSRTTAELRTFALRFKHVRIAMSVSVTIPPRMPAPLAAVGAATEQPLGQQATTPGVPTSKLATTSKLFDLGSSAIGLAGAVF